MKTASINKKYPFLLWLTSITIGAFFVEIFWYKDIGAESLQMIALYLVFGAGLSLPVFIIFLISFWILTNRLSSGLLIKVLLDIIVIIGVFITFAVIKGSMELTTSLIYSGSVILSSTFYNIYVYKE